PAEFLSDHLARQLAPAGKAHRRQELSVRHLLEAFARGAHSDKRLQQIVVRSQILVTQRPIFTIPVTARGLELVVAVTVALPRPAERLPPNLAPTHPHK